MRVRRYDQVADRIADLIGRGALRAGDRMPSVRELARQERVSVATVVTAYCQLEARGVVEVRPQSGHYVRAPRPALREPRPARPTSVPIRPAVARLIAEVYQAVRDPRIVNLGAAFPSHELLPTEKLARILGQVAKTAGGRGVDYDPPPGCPILRRQVARRMTHVGCPIGAEEIVTTVGAMEALDVALRAVAKPGDTIAIESPTYYGLLMLIESLGIKAIEVPSHAGSGLDLDALEDAVRQHAIAAVLAVPSFANPLGSRMPDEAKARLVTLLAARGIPLIEDDIYGDLPFPSPDARDDRPRPAKAWDRDGGVILCSSFSKTIAPGYRVGWVAGGRYRDAIEQLKFAQTVCTPTLTQLAVSELIASGGYDLHLRRLRRALATQVTRAREAIACCFPEGTRVTDPRGGFVLWVELPPGTSSIELHARALARRISVAPGPLFSAKLRFSNYLRLSCGQPWTLQVEAAFATVGKIACELSGRSPARRAG